jgi:FkbM family methyltransferase
MYSDETIHIPWPAKVLRSVFGNLQHIRGAPRLLWMLRSCALPKGQVLVDTPDGLPITIFRDDYVELMLYYFPYCLDLRALIRDILKPGDICFDLGSNVGVLAAAMAKEVLPNGRVIAVDPGQRVNNQLRNTVNLFWPGKIEIIEAGISNSIGKGKLTYPQGGYSQSGEVLLDTDLGESIRLTTIDALVESQKLTRAPDFIKVDIEGNEVYLVKSMKKLLSRGERPILDIEFHSDKCNRRGITADTVRKNLLELGYMNKMVVLDRGSYQLSGIIPETIRHENLLFITPIHLQKYPRLATSWSK